MALVVYAAVVLMMCRVSWSSPPPPQYAFDTEILCTFPAKHKTAISVSIHQPGAGTPILSILSFPLPAAKTKADKHLAALASISATVSPGNSSGEMFDMFAGDSGGLGSLGGAGMGGFPGLGGGSGPGLMDMLGTGAGEGGRGGVGSLMNMLMGGAGGTGGAGGRGAGAGMDKKQMLKTAKKMSKVIDWACTY